jgi:rubredoxin
MSKVSRSYVFECPNCKYKEFEEVVVDAVQYSPFREVDVEMETEGDNLIHFCEPNIINTFTEDGSLGRYQCAKCGWVLPGVKDQEALAEWLIKHGIIKREYVHKNDDGQATKNTA